MDTSNFFGALKSGDPDKVQRLIDDGINPDAVDTDGEKTALHLAIIHLEECSAVVQRLLELGTNLNLRDEKGNTALHYATQLGILKFCSMNLLLVLQSL